MKIQNFNRRSLFAILFSVAFAVALNLSATREAAAQRYLTELKPAAGGVSQFASDLSEFLTLAESIQQDNVVLPRELTQLEAAGKKVKDGTSNFRQSLEGLIGKIKKDNQWNDALDTESIGVLGNRKIKNFFQNNGARKILTEALNAYNTIPAEVDAIINNARKTQSVNFNEIDGGIFMKTSFAASSSARKVRFKCVLLGAAIFGAEIVKADRTAENLDKIFDKGCGAGASTTT